MNDIDEILRDVEEREARSALYYTLRYVKQAKNFAKYGKDIFDDEARSVPSDKVREIARKLIVAVEKREGAPATDFSFEKAAAILRELTQVENRLGAQIKGKAMERARNFVSSMTVPRAN